MRKRLLYGLAAMLCGTATADAQNRGNSQSRPTFAPAKQAKPAPEFIRTSADIPSPPADPATPPKVAARAVPNYTLPPSIQKEIDDACGEPETGGCCDNLCGPPGRIWGGGGWLLWTTKGNYLPPLLTGAPNGQAGVPGALGNNGTQLLIGNQGVNSDWRSGLRFYGGIWLDREQKLGIEGDFLYLGQSSQTLTGGSNGTATVTRPFINSVQQTAPGVFSQVQPFQDTQLVSLPNIVSGTTSVNSSTDFMGAGANIVRNLRCTPCARLDLLVGYRYLNLNDTLMIEENLTALPGSGQAGSTFLVQDRYRTENHFNGGVLGLAYERRFNRMYLGIRSSVALGATYTITDIDGATMVTSPNGTKQNLTGGLLAQPSNIGRYESTQFSVVPEIGLKLGLQVTDHFRVFAGYNFLYWNNVTRTGEVIDMRLNASQIPPRNGQTTGALFPQYIPRTTDFFAHGLMLGAELRY